MEDVSSCANIKNHCDENHITFDKDCAEYKFQKDVLNTAYSNKTSFRIAKFILQPNDKSYAASIKTNILHTTRNTQHSTQPSPYNNTMTQQSVRPTTPITATGTNTTSSVPAASFPGFSGTTGSNKTVATKSFPPTGNATPNKSVAVKSTSKPQRPPRHASNKGVLGKTSSLPDLTESQNDSNDFFSSQFTTPKTTHKSNSKEGINKLPVSSKFYALTDDNVDSV